MSSLWFTSYLVRRKKRNLVMSSTAPNPPTPVDEQSVLQRVQSLRDQLDGLTTADDQEEDRRIGTGCEALDRLLPGGAFAAGMLVEWLAEGRGSGAGSLAMVVARQAVLQRQGSLVVVDRWRRFYPPAAVAWGIDPSKLIVVRGDTTKKMAAQEELWAIDQALRCPGVSAVWTWIDRLDPRAFRRLQLAAETGQTLGLLVRPATVRARPTWSDAQLLVEPQRVQLSASNFQPTVDQAREPRAESGDDNRRCQVTLLRQRGRAAITPTGTSVEVEIDEQQGTLKEVRQRHESRHLHLASRMAHPATPRRSAGA